MSIIDTLNELFTDFGVKATLSVERNPFWKFFSSGRTVNRLPEGIAEGAKAPPEWNRAPRRAKAWQQPEPKFRRPECRCGQPLELGKFQCGKCRAA